jgi:uncharacterized protein
MTRALVAFFTATFAATWLAWAAAGAITGAAPPGDPAASALAGVVFLLGVFAPALVALALTARAEGRAEAAALLGRVLRWRVDARWYLLAVGLVPAVELSAALVHRVVLGTWPPFGHTPWYEMAGALLVSTWAQAGEEIGWRGFALPRLSARVGLAAAGILVGIAWAAWHLPLFFFFPAADTYHQSFPLYLLQVTALSVIAAWLYWRTGGSLLLVMLLHAAANNTRDIVSSAVAGATEPLALSTSPAAWITLAMLWIPAAYCLLRMRGVTTLFPDDRAADEVRGVTSPAMAVP